MITKILSLLLIILFSPILAIVAAIVIMDDGSPAIFKQKRVGINNSLFNIYKFRTMKKHIRDIPTHLVSDPSSLYTRTGKYLRMLSIDELPQLFNLLKGDMVFIGPRPALYNQLDLIELRSQRGVQNLLPGVTGWAQVNGRDELSIEQKVEYDDFYAKNKSFRLNMKILGLTVIRTLKIENISH